AGARQGGGFHRPRRVPARECLRPSRQEGDEGGPSRRRADQGGTAPLQLAPHQRRDVGELDRALHTRSCRRDHRWRPDASVEMRITALREKTVSIGAPVRNASIAFDAMTASALVVETDAMRNGKKVCGVAFDSVGRYGHGGLLRERFFPRLLSADPQDYLDG